MTHPPTLADPAPAPTSIWARLDSLDLLRGVAILGILLMNTQSMGFPVSAYLNPTTYGNFRGGNWYVWAVIHVLADMKFITTFSILFGAGILLQGMRVAARDGSPAAVHYKRMFVLLGFGLIHAHFFWSGDILVPYALCGMILFPIRRLPVGVLTLLGVGLIAMVTFIYAASTYGFCEPVLWVFQHAERLVEGLNTNEAQLTAYRQSFLAQAKFRFWLSLEAESTMMLYWTFWRCGGAMLLGMALLRGGFFHGNWPRTAYLYLGCFAVPVGWIITILGIVYNTDFNWNWDYLLFLGAQLNYWGSLITAMGYISLGVLIALSAAERPWVWQLVQPLRCIGRTALSNYILQTLICTTIFNGHGLGYFGEFSRFGLLLLTLAVWTVQLTLTPIYLRYFKQGPLEWLWHRLVYSI
jgi:uncharacterized protein